SGFTRTGNSGYTGENPEWQLDVDIFQIVLSRTEDLDRRTPLSSRFRNRNGLTPRKVISSERWTVAAALWAAQSRALGRASHREAATEKIQWAIPNQVAAVLTPARAEIDEIVRRANDLFLMLDNQQRVPFIAQFVHAAHHLPNARGVYS